MNHEIQIILNRQSEWQKNRSKLSWGNKLRQSIILRETGVDLRKGYVAHRQINVIAEERSVYRGKGEKL